MFTKILAAELYDERIAALFPQQFTIVPADDEQIARICNRMDESQIILLKRPESIPGTAKLLADKIRDKTIILVSVENPMEQSSIEELMNLGAALAFAQTLAIGTYVVQNNKCYHWNEMPMNTTPYTNQAVA